MTISIRVPRSVHHLLLMLAHTRTEGNLSELVRDLPRLHDEAERAKRDYELAFTALTGLLMEQGSVSDDPTVAVAEAALWMEAARVLAGRFSFSAVRPVAKAQAYIQARAVVMEDGEGKPIDPQQFTAAVRRMWQAGPHPKDPS
ncbi:MAG: hypothetical protein OXE43_08165 [Chloroflexi bacterium]|nr:hypothetical protein [Chloroflexota bacterium]